MCLSINDGKYIFGCAIFFKGSIVYAGLASGCICSSSKEAKARAVLFALNRGREFQLDNIFVLTYFLEVVRAIEWNEDWILRSCGG